MASSACPICSRHFRPENLAMHVEFCLNKSARGSLSSPPASLSAFSGFSTSKKRPLASSATANRSVNRPGSAPPAAPAAGLSPGNSVYSATPAYSYWGGGSHHGDDDTDATLGSASKKRKRLEEPLPVPLAERMRPTALADLVGQDEVVGPGKALAALIEADRVPNMILWGPPGCGKTTLAHVVARSTKCKFIALSGATSASADMRDALERARGERKLLRRRTILFVDEIHRFNKNQQDILLPAVEDGTVTLIGATTENPSFELNNALLSRCRVYTLQKHSTESIDKILRRALTDHAAGGLQSLLQHGMSGAGMQEQEDSDASSNDVVIKADDDAIAYIANQCGGDARVALNCLEIALQTANLTTNASKSNKDADTKADSVEPGDADVGGGAGTANVLHLTEAHVRHCFAHRQTLLYDRKADFHYDLISALHKSVRGSDANAALYWLARMLEGGENPLYIGRRLIRMASEDIGLAAPEMLPIAVSAYQAAHFLGMPECDVVLAQCAAMLARAPKSIEVYGAYKRAKQSIRDWDRGPQPDVPLHLRNAPTQLMKDVGYAQGYLYNPHHTAEELCNQTYLPNELLGTDFFFDEDVDDVRRRSGADESKESE